MPEFYLLSTVAAAITLLLFFVITLKVHAFVALFLVSLFAGLATGMSTESLLFSMQKGMGETLGFVAVIVGLGAMFGQMLDVSGGASRLSHTLIRTFGEHRVPWALGFTGFFVGIPVFFDVGFILLMPVVYRLAQKSGRSLLYYALPLFAGLSAAHSLIPPTPGPIAVAHLIGADLGWMILFGLIAGIPAMIISGPLFGTYIAGKIQVPIPDYIPVDERVEDEDELPGFGLLITIIAIPLLLMLLNTTTAAFLTEASNVRAFFAFAGHPFTAMLLSVLLVFYFLGIRRGYSKNDVLAIAGKAIQPTGMIMLVTGAGGVFKQVLIDSDLNSVLGGILAESSMPPLVLGYFIAAAIRILQGSATVAMVTSAGLMASIIEPLSLEGPVLGLLAISIAAGGIIASHVNDSGFWLINRYLGLDVKNTLKTWTVLETLTSLTSFIVILIVSLVFF
ncbi:GntT/GntP/DsdX family permease [Domibacillus indicus]|uniref:GntT/GntP/DsdX family permease n=1 Tax=Domibacillus indicus TaxID=1437523 RepID=UPI000617D3A4|nr:gluconate:H+ symporter [Domibacillus indicus]